MWKELGGGGFPSCMIAVTLCDQAHESHAGWFLWGTPSLPYKTVSGWEREKLKSKISIRERPKQQQKTNQNQQQIQGGLKEDLNKNLKVKNYISERSVLLFWFCAASSFIFPLKKNNLKLGLNYQKE